MIKSASIILAVFAVSMSVKTFAQALPATDLWLTQMDKGVPFAPRKISTRNGYNNQPHFSGDGQFLYYTREMALDDGTAQTDIAVFDTKTSTTAMVNRTPQSEYSPTPIPGREAVSVIQVEADQKQRLWAIDIPTGKMDLLFANMEPVGYHAWVNDHEVAMFILGDTFTLQTARLDNSDTQLVAGNIGRSIRKHPLSNEVLFVDKSREPWQITAFDADTTTVRNIMPLFPNGEDFTIDEQGNYWTGNGSKLYMRSVSDTKWQLMADFKAFGIQNITRLAVNLKSHQVALVSDKLVPD